MSTPELDQSSEVPTHNIGHARDVEKGNNLSQHLTNNALTSFSWSDIGVTVEDRKTKKPIQILSFSHGSIQAGDVVALMGKLANPLSQLFRPDF